MLNPIFRMEHLHDLDYAALVDLLAVYTEKYTQMIADRNMTSPEFYECKIMVKRLQKEIEARVNPTDDNELFLEE
jgi:hypothetical protein